MEFQHPQATGLRRLLPDQPRLPSAPTEAREFGEAHHTHGHRGSVENGDDTWEEVVDQFRAESGLRDYCRLDERAAVDRPVDRMHHLSLLRQSEL